VNGPLVAVASIAAATACLAAWRIARWAARRRRTGARPGLVARARVAVARRRYRHAVNHGGDESSAARTAGQTYRRAEGALGALTPAAPDA
jgi:hypothetical protein